MSKNRKRKWVVAVQGEPLGGDDVIPANPDRKFEEAYEISVVIEGTHGESSFGWDDGEEKIILFEWQSNESDIIDPQDVEPALPCRHRCEDDDKEDFKSEQLYLIKRDRQLYKLYKKQVKIAEAFAMILNLAKW